jgi:hypothetical protein
MPMPPRSLSDVLWLPGKFVWVFGKFELGLGRTDGGLSYRWSPVFAVVMVWGFWALWRKQHDAALFLLLPVAVCITLSAASLYPFTARTIAFLIPSVLLATAAGASHILSIWPDRWQFLTPVMLAVLGGAPIYATATTLPPSRVQHIRPVLQHVNERRLPGDKIFVYYGAGPAFGFYAPRLGIPAQGVVFGRCGLADPRRYLRELDAMRGSSRVWIVVTHVQRSGELELITGYLDQIGRRLDAVVVSRTGGYGIEGAYGFLYDLSDRDRLVSTSSEIYVPVLAPAADPWRLWGCYGVVGQPY